MRICVPSGETDPLPPKTHSMPVIGARVTHLDPFAGADRSARRARGSRLEPRQAAPPPRCRPTSRQPGRSRPWSPFGSHAPRLGIHDDQPGRCKRSRTARQTEPTRWSRCRRSSSRTLARAETARLDVEDRDPVPARVGDGPPVRGEGGSGHVLARSVVGQSCHLGPVRADQVQVRTLGAEPGGAHLAGPEQDHRAVGRSSRQVDHVDPWAHRRSRSGMVPRRPPPPRPPCGSSRSGSRW